MKFIISKAVCSGCGTCLDVCPVEAISLSDGKAEISMACTGCGACPRVCPEGAIKMQTMAPATPLVP